jgi:tetratricopeptide (TPR) repeat protein
LSQRRQIEGEQYLKAAAGFADRIARLDLAEYYAKGNRTAEALAILGSMSSKDDGDGAVTLLTAAIEFRSGKRDQAMRRLDALLARTPDNNHAVILKAQLLFSAGNLAPALPLAREAVSRDPTSIEARSTLGKLLFATGDLESAYQEFSEAFRADPESVQLPLQLADLSIELGRRQEALQYARDAVRKNPANADAAVALVKTLVALRDYSSAEWELKSLLARHPSSADLLVQLGAVNLGRGDSAAARSAFARALQLDRDSLDGLSGMASLDLKERRIADARKRVDEALAAHPQDPEYLLLAARVYAADNDAGRAESTFRRALDLDRANEGAALALSDFLNTQHRRDEAKRVLEQALERRPGSVAMQTSLGMLLEQMGRSADAKALYEKIVGRTSRASTAASRLAALYVEQGGNLDVALSLATTAKQQLPDDPAISDVLGQVYTRKNLPGVAVRHLQEAVRAAPDNAVYRFHLGTAYLRDGQIKPARGELTRALQIDPTFAQADQARAALASMPK